MFKKTHENQYNRCNHKIAYYKYEYKYDFQFVTQLKITYRVYFQMKDQYYIYLIL